MFSMGFNIYPGVYYMDILVGLLTHNEAPIPIVWHSLPLLDLQIVYVCMNFFNTHSYFSYQGKIIPVVNRNDMVIKNT